MPYITSSIILQLLTVVVPTLEKLQKEGELGRRKITQWTRYLTVALGIAQSFGIAIGLQSMQDNIVISPGIGFVLMTILSLTTGTAFIMWLGEQITERGIGNGMSLIIFTGIVVGIPGAIGNLYTNVFVTHEWSPLVLGIVLIMMIAVVAFIVLVEMGERRIPVQYAKRVIGRRVMGMIIIPREPPIMPPITMNRAVIAAISIAVLTQLNIIHSLPELRERGRARYRRRPMIVSVLLDKGASRKFNLIVAWPRA